MADGPDGIEKKEPCFVHCKECRHEWPAFYMPLALDTNGMRLLRAAGKMPCPMCASRKVFMGRAPQLTQSRQPDQLGE